MVDVAAPLPINQARKLLSAILAPGEGSVSTTKHAREEMAKDRMVSTDVVNVLRCGQIREPAEEKNGAWRYRVHTNSFCVVVEFLSETQVRVVTTWRKKGR